MMYLCQPYDDALRTILSRGIKKKDRTGKGCIGVAGLHSVYPLDQQAPDGNFYFPIVTGRKLFPKAVFAELLWFLSGSTLNQDLERMGCKFWGKWCDEKNPKYVEFRAQWGLLPGDFGPIYGWQLRHFGADYLLYRELQSQLVEAVAAGGQTLLYYDTDRHLPENPVYRTVPDIEEEMKECLSEGEDQLAYVMNILKTDPFGSDGRRCLWSLWNPKDLKKQALPPCHYGYQAIPDGDGGLTGIMTQRSCDFPVGVPANIQFYAAFTIMLAQQCGMKPRELIHETHDCHIYLDQIDPIKEYLTRPVVSSPKLKINQAASIYDYKLSDFELIDYVPNDKIDMPVAV